MRKIILSLAALSILMGAAGQQSETVENASRVNARGGSAGDPGSTEGKYMSSNMVNKIRDEGLRNSKVMEYAFYLTDVSGPRLTVSPGFTKAANWAKNELTRLGLVNARLEPWGEFGKGWQQERCYIAMTAPYYQPIIAVPRAWSGSTPGKKPVAGEIVLINAQDSAGLLKYAGKLGGKIVMTFSPAEAKPSFNADGKRYTDQELYTMSQFGLDGNSKNNDRTRIGGDSSARNERMKRLVFQRQLDAFLTKEKPALILGMNANGTDGTVFVSGGPSYAKDAVEGPASVMLSTDDYLRLQRLAVAGVKVNVEADVRTKFYTEDIKGYNVIAEIPGTDPLLKDEVVMLGGHLDSWHGATGATDNAAGCAVMMEAVRIIKTLGEKPKRTIRIALWSGEEQGLLGSRNYVKTHLGDRETMALLPAHEKISAYYNLDNGSGKIRGIYLQGNDEAGKIFSSWLRPFQDLGATTITRNNTGGTDHLAFDAVGIPGFQFIQDELEYDTRTHHTNMDTYDHLVADDLKQASTVVAAFVFNTAQLERKIPRKQLPAPASNGRRF